MDFIVCTANGPVKKTRLSLTVLFSAVAIFTTVEYREEKY